jgi:hypothetical protein
VHMQPRMQLVSPRGAAGESALAGAIESRG